MERFVQIETTVGTKIINLDYILRIEAVDEEDENSVSTVYVEGSTPATYTTVAKHTDLMSLLQRVIV